MWIVEQEAGRDDNAAVAVVGTAICSAIRREAREESQRLTGGQPPLSDADLLSRALARVSRNLEFSLSEAEQIVQQRSIDMLEECAYRAVERARQETEQAERPIFFALWTGIAANFLWLFVSFLIVVAAMVILGAPSLDDVLKNAL